MTNPTTKEEVQKWLSGLLGDPTSRMLLKDSHLTKTQLETFLIDILAEKTAGSRLIYEKKAKLRLIKSGVSRGAFNRTLAQARRNIIRSVYTIILLGYLGIFDSPCMEPYVEIANKIRSYTDAYRVAAKRATVSPEHLRIIGMLRKEIERGLEELSGVRSMSQRP